MPAEQVDVADDEPCHERRQNSRVQGEETGQGMVAVFGAADDNFLQAGPYDREDDRQIGCDFCGPESFLVLREKVAGE